MTTITCDTLKFANRLKAAGVPDKQAEMMSESMTTTLATKLDMAEVKTELRIMKWMLSLTLAGMAGVLTLLLKIAIH